MKVGISCSGGGLRSATFTLGALSELWRTGVFSNPVQFSAVSGGNYAAIAFLVTATASEEADPAESNTPGLWGIDSPEMRALRTNCDSIARSWLARGWLILLMVRSMVINLASATMCVLVLGYICGRLGADLRSISDRSVALFAGGALLGPLVVAVLGVALPYRPSSSAADRGRPVFPDGDAARRLSLSSIAIGLIIFGVWATDHVLTWAHRFGQNPGPPPARLRFGLLPAAGARSGLLFVLGLLVAALTFTGLTLAVPRPWRPNLRAALAVMSGVAMVGLPFLWAFDGGRLADWSSVGVGVAALSGGLVLFLVAFDANKYSVFPIYRGRLRSVFFWRRTSDGSASAKVDETSGRMLSRLRLSELQTLVAAEKTRPLGVHRDSRIKCCAAVGLSDRTSRDGRIFDSFTFGDVCGSHATERMDLAEYEGRAFPSSEPLDLASLMAISGAALSPSMGRLSRRGYPLVLALLNFRFGVWLNSPLHLEQTVGDGAVTRLWTRIRRRPSVFHVYLEAMSSLSGKRSCVFISDGGHYENLGLVELVDEDVDVIVSIDASLEAAGSLTNFHYALSVLRRSGVEFSLDDEPEFQSEGHLSEPFVTGWLVRADGRKIFLVYLRCELFRGMSPDLRGFADKNPHFPRHPTLYQFLSADVVDAYHLLGKDVVARARVSERLL